MILKFNKSIGESESSTYVNSMRYIITRGENPKPSKRSLIEELEDDIYQSKCEHNYHKECITTWFQTSKSNNCPLCKSKIEEMQIITANI